MTFRQVVFGTFLLVVACLGVGAGRAAPVPPPPRLTPELLYGKWHYEYGQMKDGCVEFNRDGTYIAKHDRELNWFYIGTWRVESQVVVLDEFSFHPAENHLSSSPTRWEYHLSTRDYPTLTGTSSLTGARVVLSDPER